MADHAIGIDSHKVFSGPKGDWGTLMMQGYVMGVEPMRGSDGSGAAMFMYRIFNLNVTRFGRGRFNVRVGHFEIPFGLEHVVNTNGTLRDFMHGQNLGLKADWGAGVNGTLGGAEYQFTVSRGTGNAPFAQSPSAVFAGRVGTPSNGNVVVGASAFSGLERRRFGADVAWYRGLYGVLAETAVGDDRAEDSGTRLGAANTLVEVNRTTGDDRALAYLQGRFFRQETADGWTSAVSTAAGIRFAVDTHWSVSAEYAHALRPSSSGQGRVVRAQLRYRF